MNTLTITPPKGFEVDTVKSTFQEIVFKEIQIKYPMSVLQIPNRNWYCVGSRVEHSTHNKDLENVSSEERAKQFLALIQLVELCDAWNKADVEVINWQDKQIKYVIYNVENKISSGSWTAQSYPIAFGKKETRDLFQKTFPELLEQAKPLL